MKDDRSIDEILKDVNLCSKANEFYSQIRYHEENSTMRAIIVLLGNIYRTNLLIYERLKKEN